LTAGDANGASDVFLFDRSSGQTTRVSPGTDGASFAPCISGNGRYVAFASDATDIIGAGNDNNGWTDVFLFDRQNPASIARVSITGGVAEANRNSNRPSITSTGQFVVFESTAQNLVPNKTTTLSDIIMRGPLN
jgi:Tol biopolymer transport system component